MKFQLLIIFVLVSNCSILGQMTVRQLNPHHAEVLRIFFDKNPEYSFLSEELYDAEYLKDMRKERGKQYMPYYKVGDFNRDGILDFALFVRKEGQPKQESQVSPHDYSYPISLIIFNGNKNKTFRKAFLRDEMSPYVMYLDWTNEKAKRLFYGMDGGLGGTLLTPVGKGYIAETVYH